jgi:hypothetical protein
VISMPSVIRVSNLLLDSIIMSLGSCPVRYQVHSSIINAGDDQKYHCPVFKNIMFSICFEEITTMK